MLVWVKKRLNKDWAFPDVNEERVWRPTTDELDKRRGYTVFCKGGGSPCAHWLTRDIAVKELVETSDEKVPGGNAASGCDPKGRR